MPKAKAGLTINLNLLKPQSNPEQIYLKLIRWLLSSGRFIFVFVEAIVLIAFGARFKLDADLASKNEAINAQIPYIESLKPYEILIRQTQLKLSIISNVKRTNIDWTMVLKKIADQTPLGVKIDSISIKKDVGNSTVNITGQTEANNDLISFITGLKSDNTFTNISLPSVGLDNGSIKFSIEASINQTNIGEKNL